MNMPSSEANVGVVAAAAAIAVIAVVVIAVVVVVVVAVKYINKSYYNQLLDECFGYYQKW